MGCSGSLKYQECNLCKDYVILINNFLVKGKKKKQTIEDFVDSCESKTRKKVNCNHLSLNDSIETLNTSIEMDLSYYCCKKYS
jgi:hypothetical protein